MEEISFQTIEDQKIAFPPLPQPIEAQAERVDSATQISSNQHVDDANGSSQQIYPSPLPNTPHLKQTRSRGDSQVARQEQIQNRHRIIREGYIEKSTESFFNKWQMCYCVLTVSRLYFFQDHMRVKMNSCINLGAHSSTIQRDGLHITLRLHDYEEPIVLKAYLEREAEGWMDNIGSIIQYQINSSKVTLLECKKNIYREKDTFLQSQFLESAQTGDILLMTTTDTQCAIQRFVTNSEYDHIAMVVKFNGEVKIFQSNADQGVNVYTWAQFQACFHQYQKICYRKLHFNGRAQAHHQLVKFIKSTVGKKYQLKVLSLMRKSSEDQHHSTRGYFCSQLVAKVYKIFGLLESEKASSTYWPVDFTMRGGMNLLKCASLGREKTIILNKHLKYTL